LDIGEVMDIARSVLTLR